MFPFKKHFFSWFSLLYFFFIVSYVVFNYTFSFFNSFHLLHCSFIALILSAFFFFSTNAKCTICNMQYTTVMIGLTNALCNHCAPSCYWQTLNHWPRCQFSMNANKMWWKSRCFILDANAFHKDADVKCPYDADVPCKGSNAKFIHDGASAHI